MLKLRMLACLTVLLLTGCETTGPVVVTDTGCDWAKPILIHKTLDRLTQDTALQILAHNETGAIRCGWKPNTAPK